MFALYSLFSLLSIGLIPLTVVLQYKIFKVAISQALESREELKNNNGFYSMLFMIISFVFMWISVSAAMQLTPLIFVNVEFGALPLPNARGFDYTLVNRIKEEIEQAKLIEFELFFQSIAGLLSFMFFEWLRTKFAEKGLMKPKEVEIELDENVVE